MTSYISQTEITEEKYIEIINRPIGREASTKLKRWKTAKLAGIAVCAVMCAVCTAGKDYDFALIAGVFAVVFAYQLFIQRKQSVRKMYRQSLQSMNTDRWIRTITFDEKITVADGNSSTVFAYSDYKWAEETDSDYLLFRNENILLRVEKGSFTYGKEENFLRWIQNKLSTK